MTRLALVLVACAACVRSNSVECGDAVCPEGTRCYSFGGTTGCASRDQIAACDGLIDGDACAVGTTQGTCSGGVCVPALCGNTIVEPGEMCDDGNFDPGDGCSQDCTSNEQCGNGVLDPGEDCDDGARFSHDGCSAGCRAEVPTWRDVTTAIPEERAAPALAFDGVRATSLAFGGRGAGGALGDTWQWDGSVWTRLVTPIAPAPREQHAMAYDTLRRRVVLFGGTQGGSTRLPLDDTWEWDGTRWRVIDAAPPPGRFGHGMVYDPRRQRVVMFGGTVVNGSTPKSVNDAWEWDGMTWKQIAPIGAPPPPRSRAAMGYDPVRATIVVFGGSDGITTFADTWELAGATWTRVTPSGGSPPARARAAMAFDPILRRVVLVGGDNGAGKQLGDVWAWNGATWDATALAAITPRSEHAMSVDPVRGALVVFGGLNGALLSNLVLEDVSPLRPALDVRGGLALPARGGAAFAYDTAGARGWMFGGTVIGLGANFDDLWRLARSVAFVLQTTAPDPRTDTAMAYDDAHAELVLFGGVGDSGQVFGDTWTVADAMGPQPLDWTKRSVLSAPAPRVLHAMSYDGATRRVVLFGGNDATGKPLGDTWLWNGTAWTQSAATGPSPRPGAALGYDPVRARIVLFGGGKIGGALANDTWEWDGVVEQWQPLAPVASPPPRTQATLTWNPTRKRLTLFGGTGVAFAALDDVWEWDGTRWSELVAAGEQPPPRSGHAALPSSDGSGFEIVGGRDTTLGQERTLGDVWRFQFASAQLDDLCRDGTDVDGDGLAGCADPDCWAFCTPGCWPGTSCDPRAPHCGDGVASAIETCATCPADAGACLPVCGDGVCSQTEMTTQGAMCAADCL